MPSITVESVAIPNWQLSSDVQLRIYALEPFIASDGTLIEKGNPDTDEAESANFFVAVGCTLSGTTLTIEEFSLYSTTDSEDNPGATYGAFFFTTEGERIGPFGQFAKFALQSAPTTTSWATIEAQQIGA